MKRCATLIAALVMSGAVCVSSASADPTHNTAALAEYTCDNGQTVLVNSGTVTNRSHQGFVFGSNGTISSTSIYVVKYLALTDSGGTTVLFDTRSGSTHQPLVTCTVDLGGGTTLTAQGFFSPRGVTPVAKSTSSRLLCLSYGGTFATGPDLIGALPNPVIWVCNGWTVPESDFQTTIDRKIIPLGDDCMADGGVVLYARAISPAPVGGDQAFVVDTTCYGPV